MPGEIAALLTAVCWTITAMSFESAGRRIGSMVVNLLRLVLALVFLSVFGWITRGHLLPTDAGAHAWIWLSISGLVGFTIGDLALFRAFVLIGSRISMLLMSLVPPLTAIFGWVLMGEGLSPLDITGMTLTVLGVMLVVSQRQARGNEVAKKLPVKGIALGLLGALGQAGGLVLSKYGMGDYDAFAATQIRVIAGTIGFSVMFTAVGWWPNVAKAFKDKGGMSRMSLGAFFGPFLGVSFSLLAVQNIQAGVAATVMSITPILMIAPAALLFKERITPRAVLGAVIAVAGVALVSL
jgi:drug/metabolite transporter (DMT)-like permease